MKNNLKLLLSILCLVFAFKSYGQSETSMMPIFEKSPEIIKIFEDKNLEIVRMEYDIVKTSKESYRTLVAGYTYGLFAFGDWRITNLNVKLYKNVDGVWALLSQDDTNESSAAITGIKPSVTGEYKIVIEAGDFGTNSQGTKYSAGHYCLLIFHN